MIFFTVLYTHLVVIYLFMPIVIGIIVLAVVGISVGFLVSNNDQPVTTDNEIVTETTSPEESSNQEEVVEADMTTEARQEDAVDEVASEPANEEAVSTNTYANGSYTAESFYFTPRRTRHDMEITLEVEDDVVVDANVTYDGAPAETPNHTRFDEAYRAEVVGQRLEDVYLSRTGGASLTSDSFNEAVETIKAEASA